jgi:hypothetical protein
MALLWDTGIQRSTRSLSLRKGQTCKGWCQQRAQEDSRLVGHTGIGVWEARHSVRCPAVAAVAGKAGGRQGRQGRQGTAWTL